MSPDDRNVCEPHDVQNVVTHRVLPQETRLGDLMEDIAGDGSRLVDEDPVLGGESRQLIDR